MSTKGLTYVEVFAVVRVETSTKTDDPQLLVKVKEILPTYEEAAAEADRLNDLNASLGVHYMVQSSHWYPDGRPSSNGAASP